MEIVLSIISFIGGLAMFLYGMKVMGTGLERMSGGKLEGILERLTSNKVKGVLLGLIVTAMLQCSSATTVMAVGFVNSSHGSYYGCEYRHHRHRLDSFSYGN